MGATYNGNGTVGLEKRVQALQKLKRKEVDGFRAAGKDVVHNVVEACAVLGVGQLLGVPSGVRQHRLIVLGEVKVFLGKRVHHGVNLDDGGVDAVRHQRRGCRPDSQATTHVSLAFAPLCSVCS